MTQSAEQVAEDLNRVAAWMAQDDFGGSEPEQSALDGVTAIILLGNQVVATLSAACRLALRAPGAVLLFSGGAGHSTVPLLENLRASDYRPLAASGAVAAGMNEAEMYAVAAQLAHGIAARQILVENRSRNAGENARYCLQTLKLAGVRPGTALIKSPRFRLPHPLRCASR